MRLGSPGLLLALASLLGCARGVALSSGSGGGGGSAGGSGGAGGNGGGSGGNVTGSGGSGSGASGSGGSGSGASGSGASGSGASGSGASGSGASGSGASGSGASGSGASGSGASGGAGPVDCDPLNPVPGCGAGEHCLPNANGIPDCAPAGPGVQFTLCQSVAECAPIYECVSDGVDACCLQYCTSDLDCGLGLSCASFSTPIYVGVTEYGVCTDGLPCVL